MQLVALTSLNSHASDAGNGPDRGRDDGNQGRQYATLQASVDRPSAAATMHG